MLTGIEEVSDTLNQIQPVTNSQAFFGGPHQLVPDGGVEYFAGNLLQLNQWMLWVFITALLFIALARYFYPARFTVMLKAVFALRPFSQLEKDGTFFRETPTYLLSAAYMLVFSLLVSLTLGFTGQVETLSFISAPLVYAGILAFIALFYVTKIIVLSHLAWVFSTQRATSLYLQNIFLVNQLMGLAVFPLVFYSAFNPGAPGLLITWVLVVIIASYKVIRGAILGFRASGFSLYYLILYLCAVELAPLLVVGKAASIYLFNN